MSFVMRPYRTSAICALAFGAVSAQADLFDVSYTGFTPLQSGPFAPGTVFEFSGRFDSDNLVSSIFANTVVIENPVMLVNGAEVEVVNSALVDPRDGRIGVETAFGPTLDQPLGVGGIRIDYFTPMPVPSDLEGLTIDDVNAAYRDQLSSPFEELPFELTSFSVVLVPAPWSAGVLIAGGLAACARRRR